MASGTVASGVLTLNAILTALSPEVIYPHSIYRVGIFLEDFPLSQSSAIYTFQATIVSSRNEYNSPDISIGTGQSGDLEIPIQDLQDENYEFTLRVRDGEGREKLFQKSVRAGKNNRILIHTDKPLYNAAEEVHFSVVPLDQPRSRNTTTHIFIHDAKGYLIKSWQILNASGIFSASLPLARELNPGKWEILVRRQENQLNSISESLNFLVKEARDPEFSVMVQVPGSIVTVEKKPKLRMRIDALYENAGGVSGKCQVQLAIYGEKCDKKTSEQNITENFTINTTAEKTIDFTELFKEEHFNGATLEILVTVTEDLTGMSVRRVAVVNLIKYKYQILPFAMNNDKKARLPYQVSFRAMDSKGQPKTEMIVTLKGAKPKKEILTNGKIDVMLNSTDDVISLLYGDLIYNYQVPQHQSPGTDFLQARLIHPETFDNRISPGANLRIHVRTTFPVNSVNVAILCKNKIISTKRINLPENRDDFEIEVNLPENIGWDVRLVVFAYINKVPVSDSLRFTTTRPATRGAVLSASKSTLGPGESVDLTVQARVGTTVYLVGVEDSAVPERDRLSYDWLQRKLESANQSNSDNKINLFEGLQAFQEEGMIIQTNVPSTAPSSGGNASQSKLVSDCRTRLRNSLPPSGDTWFLRSFKVLNETTLLNLSAPEKISSWIIQGYSLDENNQVEFFSALEMRTSKRFYVTADLPFSVVKDEKLSIPILIHNSLLGNDRRSVSITISSENGGFEVIGPEGARVDGVVTVLCPPNSIMQTSVVVKPTKVGTFRVSIEAATDSERTSVQKVLKVNPPGERRVFTKSSALLALPDIGGDHVIRTVVQGLGVHPDFLISRLKSNSDFGPIKLTTASDLMAFVIKNVDDLVPRIPEGSAEVSILRFAVNIAVLSYLDATGQDETPIREKAKASLEKDYQLLLSFRKSDGSFSEFSKDATTPGSTWVTANVIRNFLSAKPYITLDERVLEEGLEFLRSQQRANGVFVGNGIVLDFAKKGTAKSGGVSLTAFCILTYLELQKTELASAGIFKFNETVARAREFMQQYYVGVKGEDTRDDAYAQALMTYAEHAWHELNPEEKTFKDEYFERFSVNGTNYTRSSGTETPEMLIERVAYNVLTHYLRKESLNAMLQLNSILNRRLSETAGFLSTQDTAVALTAVARMAEKEFLHPTDYQLNITAFRVGQNSTKIRQIHTFNVTRNLSLYEFDLPKSTRIARLNPVGTGLVFAQLSHTYDVPRTPRAGSFNISIVIANNQQIFNMKICMRLSSGGSSGLTVLEVVLPSGYNFDQPLTSESLGNVSSVRKHDFVDRNSKLVAFFASIPNTEDTCVNAHAQKRFQVEGTASSYVKVYKFFDTTKPSQQLYNLPAG